MKVEKAYALSDAKISFVSLVDKAANKRQFLITKAEEGAAAFQTYGRIVKVDAANHYVTGVVYEPLVEDSQGEYMTEEEIVKAAYWFMKNGDQVDLQHNFEPLDSASVVESWVAKSDMTVGDEEIKKGTWLLTVEVTDADIWEKVEKKEITGFSMGGVGKHSDEDIQLEGVQKTSGKAGKPVTDTQDQKKGILKTLAGFLGLDMVEKGEMAELYATRQKSSSFWNAMDTLQGLLCRGYWDYYLDKWVYDFENDEEKIREALTEFQTIISDILLQGSVTKALTESEHAKPVEKAGKKMSGANKAKLDDIINSLTEFSKGFDDNTEEDTEMEKADIQQMIDESITKAMTPAAPAAPPAQSPALTAEAVEKMVLDAVTKALGDETAPSDQPLTADTVKQLIDESITKALEPIRKARGLGTNLNDAGGGEVKKSEPHYLTGVL